MNALRNILVAIDFTPLCRVALREAVRQAAAHGAALTAVHVMKESLATELKRGLATDEVTITGQWLAHLEKFVLESDAGAVDAGIDVVIGHPLAGLARACRRHDADLLVMGVRGADSCAPRVGAVATKCVRKAPVDVLLISEDHSGAFKHVVACVDFSDNSAQAVRAALSIAQRDGAAMECVHVYQSAAAASSYYSELALVPISAGAGLMSQREAELKAFVAPLIKGATVPVTCSVIEHNGVREAIQQFVVKTQADLVVLGTRGKDGLRELMMGTTAENLVAQAPCSVLAIKPEGFVPLWSD